MSILKLLFSSLIKNDYRLSIIISKQLIMRFLATLGMTGFYVAYGEAVAIRLANRHCFPITLHQLMLSFRTNPPSGGEVRNLQLRKTITWHKKKYILYA